MTTPGALQAKGLSIFSGPALAATQHGPEFAEFGRRAELWQQEDAAVGRFWLASVRLPATVNEAEGWVQNGLGRDIQVRNQAGVIVWEGFVDVVNVSIGPLNVKVGPLLDIGNRVSVVYAPLDTTVNPPTIGARTVTTIAEDTDSQAKYGIIEKVVSAGTTTTTDAEQVRDTFLAQRANPEVTQQLNFGSQEAVMVNLDLKGYVHWFNAYVYTQIANSGTSALSTVLAAVIDADPNSLFASTNADIETNALLVPPFENSENFAWAFIKDLIAQGDASDNRYLFRVGPGQKITYSQVPTEIEYFQRLSSKNLQVETLRQSRVEPWDVEAGKWLRFVDFMVTATDISDFLADSRVMFVENVRFSTPDTLILTGGKTDKVGAALAKISAMSGMFG